MFLRYFTDIHVGFPGGSVVKNLAANAGDTGDSDSIPGLGRSPGERNGSTLQYSCLENPMDRGAWQATVCGISKSWTWLRELSMHACTHIPFTRLIPLKNFGVFLTCSLILSISTFPSSLGSVYVYIIINRIPFPGTTIFFLKSLAWGSHYLPLNLLKFEFFLH